MTPMEAWRIISEQMSELGRLRAAFAGGYVPFSENEITAQVIAFDALRKKEAEAAGGGGA